MRALLTLAALVFSPAAPAAPPAPAAYAVEHSAIATPSERARYHAREAVRPRDPALKGGEAAFRTHCEASHLAYADPILYPGQPARSHLHQFAGNTLAGASSTYGSLRRSGDGTCGGRTLNRSAYWHPAVMTDHRDCRTGGAGHQTCARRPDFYVVYYKADLADVPRLRRIPRGLSMIFGVDPMKPQLRPGSGRATPGFPGWKCESGAGGLKPSLADAAGRPTLACAPGDRLIATFTSAQCWTGALNAPDGRAHLRHFTRDPHTGANACPPGFPHLIPHFDLHVYFSHDGPTDFARWYFHSDRMPGGPRFLNGESGHSDWLGAWDDTVLEAWQAHCLGVRLRPDARPRDCTTTRFGDGSFGDVAHLDFRPLPPSQRLITPPPPPAAGAGPHHPTFADVIRANAGQRPRGASFAVDVPIAGDAPRGATIRPASAIEAENARITMRIAIIYAVFALAALAVAAKWRSATTVLGIYAVGIVLLPVAPFLGVDPTVTSNPWYIGTPIPSHLWLNKNWVAPLVALIAAALFDRARVRNFWPRPIDAPVAMLCLWPFVQMLFVPGDPAPQPLAASALLLGMWGVPWLLGRLYLNDRTGRLALLDALVGVTLILVPIAVLEGLFPVRVYELLYGPHPFALTGIERYVGYRPMAFFEDGNHYGVWVACIAVAAVWRARSADHDRRWRWAVAAILVLTAIASQSASAVVTMVIAIFCLPLGPWLARSRGIVRALTVGAVAALMGAATLIAASLAGFGPAQAIVGGVQAVLEALGRGSLRWRIGQIIDQVDVLGDHLIVGAGRYDWYAEGTSLRPWDFVFMWIGQYGLIGLALIGAMIAVALHRPRRSRAPDSRRSTRYLLITIILMAMVDAMMNTALFTPALVMLGGLAGTRWTRALPAPRVPSEWAPEKWNER